MKLKFIKKCFFFVAIMISVCIYLITYNEYNVIDIIKYYDLSFTNEGICDYINETRINYENNINIDMFKESEWNYNLSIIFGTRNDNYGGTLLDRILITLKQILIFPWYKDYGLKIEIIITQYNYIPINPFIYEEPRFIRLINQVNKMPHISDINVKFINVPFKDSYPVRGVNLTSHLYCPMIEFIAKNIALRRSKSKWILVINQDDLLPNPLLKYIANNIKSNSFKGSAVYQAPRSSIKKNHISKFNKEIKLSSVNCSLTEKQGVREAAGDFLLFHNSFLKIVGGYLEFIGHWHLDTEIIKRASDIYQYILFIIELEDESTRKHCKPLHIEHERQYTNEYDKNILLSSNNNFTEIGCDPFRELVHWWLWQKNDRGRPATFSKVELHDYKKILWYQEKGIWGLKHKIFNMYKCNINQHS